MNRICIALRGLLRPNIVLSVMSVSAAAAVLSWKDRKFWMLWKIDLPAIAVSEVSITGPTTDTTYPLRRLVRWC